MIRVGPADNQAIVPGAPRAVQETEPGRGVETCIADGEAARIARGRGEP